MTSENSESLPLVVLRRFRHDEALVHLSNEDDVTSRWLSGGVSTVESVRRWFESNEENWSNGGPRFVFAIETPDGQLAGMIEVNVDHAHFAGLELGDANVSYGLYPPFRGSGFATSAVVRVEAFMRSRGVQRGVIQAESANVDSIALAKRCGYAAKGTVVNNAGTHYNVFMKDLVERAASGQRS